MLDFLLVALPWMVMGISVAIAAVNFSGKREKLNIEEHKEADKKKSGSIEEEKDYMSAGMYFGMCFGSVLGSLGVVSLSYGISFGMLIGMVLGMCIKKK
ncbi:MAG: hypothetical protein E7208_12840 [Clostridium butyricum]|nr:hypothetical protein [Clostridium butyricum]